MTANDLELLRQFTRDQSQDAFTALVKRHVNLVYSAALRQVRSRQLAEEVAQSVFADLARNAGKLEPDTVLTAWLYAVARRTAVDVVRKESRRQLREQIAVEMNAMNATAAYWTQIEPLLDDAMAALDETDRSAILLRYFENKNLREVGEALGTSDDAAQKRVSRAVEKLREFFAKRKIAVSAGALVILISANAVQSAPVGLAATISAAAVLAGTAIHTSTIIAATKTIAMTALQKTLVTATLAVVAGAGIYEVRQAAQLREQIQTIQQQQAPLAEQIQKLQTNFADATNRLADLLAENTRLKANPHQNELLKLKGEVTQLKQADNDPANKTSKDWLTKVNKLKQRLEETPDAKIPELQFLTEQDWLNATSGKLDSGMDYRRALALLRKEAQNKFASMTESAVQKFYQNNGSQFPTDLSQLQTYFETPIDNTIMQRWQIVPATTAPNLGLGDPIITQKAAVDDLFDSRIAIGPRGMGSSDFLSSEIKTVLVPVYQAYQSATRKEPSSPSELLPYATTPEQTSLLQKVIQRASLPQ